MSGKAVVFGTTEPRIWTKPLRKLTRKTSLGFEVIDYATEILGIELRPWQKWLLVHALELNPDGSYRYRIVIVLVARQNGKTLLASVLADWWLHVDSARHPDMVPPLKFKILGTAQNLDIAREPYEQVKLWCNPEPDNDAEAELAIPSLQAATLKVSKTNGKESIRARNLAHYEIRSAANARGKPAARVLMDELREQHTWVAWNAIKPTTTSFWSGQLWGISNAGDGSSVVLKQQREVALKQVSDWEKNVESGLQTPTRYAKNHDIDTAIFEWSASDGCALDDEDGILQANPSIGYNGATVRSIASQAAGMTEAGYRTEVLCQWVTADVDTYLDPKKWAKGNDPTSKIADGQRIVLGIDTTMDGSVTWIAAAGLREDGYPHVEIVTRRDGMMWVPKLAQQIRDTTGANEIAIQGRGCRALDLIDPLSELGFQIDAIEGPKLGASTGQFRDRVREEHLKHLPQPAIDEAVSGAVARKLGDVDIWDRKGSMMDISGLIAETYALYGLEMFEPKQQQATASAYTEHDLMIL
ncbi:terminase [Bifidobacterium sp. ESL0775]|uniref:terminase n=1 Tax=Bifidobacterium sp. ESL0775 TaxID=2983230 RepID=UPI0023F68E1A|nr:terminase [Bifidobacterium sp. ESL0775]WEV68726.1 terminase [Bifidobacterium sp. ESL0775]